MAIPSLSVYSAYLQNMFSILNASRYLFSSLLLPCFYAATSSVFGKISATDTWTRSKWSETELIEFAYA